MALSLDGTTGISASGNIVGNNISVVGSLTVGSFSPGSISTAGNITGANIFTAGSISAAGNITGQNINSSNADLAELYVSDLQYSPGTVVEFGGQYEITAATQSHSTRVAGVISTAPGYLMNSTQTGSHVLPVALTGRIPCMVHGSISKGDRLVASSIKGVATVLDEAQFRPACIIGKALQDYQSTEVGTIEIAVGRT
jgi:trimeric autotransporter adhesin